MVTIGESYVERASKTIVETAILAQLRLHGPMPRDEIARSVLAGASFPKGVDRDLVLECLSRVERDEHVERDGERYGLTRDGLEDLVKIEASLSRLVPADGAASLGPGAGPPAGP